MDDSNEEQTAPVETATQHFCTQEDVVSKVQFNVRSSGCPSLVVQRSYQQSLVVLFNDPIVVGFKVHACSIWLSHG